MDVAIFTIHHAGRRTPDVAACSPPACYASPSAGPGAMRAALRWCWSWLTFTSISVAVFVRVPLGSAAGR
jgi:hypothetical protein